MFITERNVDRNFEMRCSCEITIFSGHNIIFLISIWDEILEFIIEIFAIVAEGKKERRARNSRKLSSIKDFDATLSFFTRKNEKENVAMSTTVLFEVSSISDVTAPGEPAMITISEESTKFHGSATERITTMSIDGKDDVLVAVESS
jgi:hypothetical protein